MITIEQLKQAIHQSGVTKTDAALLCVAAAGDCVATTRVRELAIQAGVKDAKTINFSSHLAAATDKVFKTPTGWELKSGGRKHVADIIVRNTPDSPAVTEAKALRHLLPKLKNLEAREFLRGDCLRRTVALSRGNRPIMGRHDCIAA